MKEITVSTFHLACQSLVEKFCCLYWEADTAMLLLYYRIKEYDQKTTVLIASEDTDVMVMCAYAASIINDEFAIRIRLQCKRHLLKGNV